MEKRLEAIEKRLDNIEKRLRKRAEKREMDLREKFRVHDYMKSLEARFEAIVSGLPDDVWFSWKLGATYEQRKVSVKELREIVRGLCKLVDNALGVRYP